MSSLQAPFEYPPSLKEYMITEETYLKQNPEYLKVATGAVVFNNEGKILLVQRAKEEKAFPNLWVCSTPTALLTPLTLVHRKYQGVKSTTLMRPFYTQ